MELLKIYIFTNNIHLLLHYLPQHRCTALHYASEGGYNDTVRELLQGGADPNVLDKVSDL